MLGLSLGTYYQLGSAIIAPSVRFSWEHDFGDAAPQSDMTLAGAAFTVDGAEEERDRYVLGAGFSAAVS